MEAVQIARLEALPRVRWSTLLLYCTVSTVLHVLCCAQCYWYLLVVRAREMSAASYCDTAYAMSGFVHITRVSLINLGLAICRYLYVPKVGTYVHTYVYCL